MGKNKIIEKIIFLAILFIGLILRLIPALRLEFWFDEAFTFSTRNMNFWQMVKYDPPHPPLFYWLMKFWSQINSTQIFLRTPVLIFSLLSILLVYKISKNLNFNNYFPLLSSLFFSLHILMIEAGIEYKMYCLVIFLMLLSLFSALKILQGENKWVVVFFLANFMGLLTDYSFIWYFISLFTGFIFLFLLNKTYIKSNFKNMFRLAWGLLISVILMLLWLPAFINNFYNAFDSTGHLYGNILTSRQKIKQATQLLFSIPAGFGNLNEIIFYFLALLSILGYFVCLIFIYRKKEDKNQKIILAFFYLVVGLFYYFSKNLAIALGWYLPHIIFEAKNSIAASFFPIFSLAGILSILLTNKNFLIKNIGTSLCFLLVFIYFKVYLTYRYFNKRLWYQSYSFKDAQEYLRRRADFSKDKFFFIRPWNNITFNYFFYNDDKNKFNLNYNLGGLQDISSPLMKTTYWLVNFEPDGLLEIEEEYVNIYNFFSKCDPENNPIYYKESVIYKCEI